MASPIHSSLLLLLLSLLLLSTPTFATPSLFSSAASALSDLPDIAKDCGRETDLLRLDTLRITPDPPQRGQKLSLFASGVLKQQVDAGTIRVQVKMGVIKLLDIGLDLCEELKYVGRECPLKEGPLELSHDLDIPNEIPPGKFTVTIHVDTPQNDEITCISARLQF